MVGTLTGLMVIGAVVGIVIGITCCPPPTGRAQQEVITFNGNDFPTSSLTAIKGKHYSCLHAKG